MSTRLVFSIVSGLVWETILVGVVVFLLPVYDMTIPLPGLIALMLVLGAISVISYRIGTRTLKRRPVVGLPSMVGSRGRAITPLNPRGTVRVKGELWQAVSTGDGIEAGQEVAVVGHDGLWLTVERARKPGQTGEGLPARNRLV